MALQRVGSLETFLVPPEGQRSRRGSVASNAPSVQAHKLTFNPLPESWNPAVPQNIDHPGQPKGAFEVSQWRRIRTCLPRASIAMYSRA